MPYGRQGALRHRPRLCHALLCTCLSLCAGCTSQVRYQRPDGSLVAPNVYRVAPNWDYREQYRIPLDRLRRIVDSYIGVAYRYGGTSRAGLDCSGLIVLVFRELNRARLPRTTRRLKQLGRVVPRAQARAGDLVFFAMKRAGQVDHAGIYMGGGRFVHASASGGVRYDSLQSDYYRTRLLFVRRLF